jgi:hypothetical protein
MRGNTVENHDVQRERQHSQLIQNLEKWKNYNVYIAHLFNIHIYYNITSHDW